MKRIAIFVLITGVSLVAFGALEAVKPVLKESHTWSMYGKPIAYYQRVKMSDGSTVELKSKTPLTEKQWQAKADEIQKAIDEQPVFTICPTCGGSGEI